ncbi:MAG: RagB/SusD family nutrient uptake outer membrane protein [Bacteroidales bacterium]|nr:RagB/SusD family nutrient uptake outer membrane protein [Bacteroidales bacterium]
MKTLKYILIVAIAFGTFSCSEDFLDRQNLYGRLDDNYYQNEQEIGEALTGVYSILPVGPGMNQPTLLGIMLSPYFAGGGGVEDAVAHGCDAFEFSIEDAYINFWGEYYKGILRVNMILKRFDQAVYEDETRRNQDLGEAHFLRAYLYFRLAQFFGTVPLITNPAPVNYPRASEEELFAQIASDLKVACEIMPSTRVQNIPDERIGHATRWAAQGLMARVFLFYTGAYDATELPLVEGGSVTKSDVIGWLEDCINNSGHQLLTHYQSLWPYSSSYTNIPEYPYIYNTGISWADETNSNYETVFAIKYNADGNHTNNYTLARANQLSLYVGVRDSYILPFGPGWGLGPALPALWDVYDNDDERKMGTLANANDPESTAVEGTLDSLDISEYTGMHATGIFCKKYIPIWVPDATGTLTNIWILMGYTTADNLQMINMQDEYVLRFADILLMAAELESSNAQNYMDQVRSRAGLGSVPASLANIKKERLYEFAGEGLYYFDLLRWGDLASVFASIPQITVSNAGTISSYKIQFKEDRKFLPVPESQVRLSEGVLEQNPGWE